MGDARAGKPGERGEQHAPSKMGEQHAPSKMGG